MYYGDSDRPFPFFGKVRKMLADSHNYLEKNLDLTHLRFSLS